MFQFKVKNPPMCIIVIINIIKLSWYALLSSLNIETRITNSYRYNKTVHIITITLCKKMVGTTTSHIMVNLPKIIAQFKIILCVSLQFNYERYSNITGVHSTITILPPLKHYLWHFEHVVFHVVERDIHEISQVIFSLILCHGRKYISGMERR